MSYRDGLVDRNTCSTNMWTPIPRWKAENRAHTYNPTLMGKDRQTPRVHWPSSPTKWQTSRSVKDPLSRQQLQTNKDTWKVPLWPPYAFPELTVCTTPQPSHIPTYTDNTHSEHTIKYHSFTVSLEQVTKPWVLVPSKCKKHGDGWKRENFSQIL